MAAKSQHRPVACWFVMGAPSSEILILKVCGVLMKALGWERTWRGSVLERADSARRFFGEGESECGLERQREKGCAQGVDGTLGSCINFCSHPCVVLMETVLS